MLATLISWEEIQQAFEFFAYILNNPPEEDFINQLRTQFLGPAPFSSTDDSHIGRKQISDYFNEHEDTPVHEMIQELAIDWTRLFRGLNSTYGPPPPYEGVYRIKDGIGVTIVQDVNKAYTKHGLLIGQHRDRSDYLGYELDFMRYLSEQAIHAQEGGQIEEERSYQNDICEFLREHLSIWIGDFCARAAEHAQTSFYSGFLLLLQETVADVTFSLCSMSLSEEWYEKL